MRILNYLKQLFIVEEPDLRPGELKVLKYLPERGDGHPVTIKELMEDASELELKKGTARNYLYNLEEKDLLDPVKLEREDTSQAYFAKSSERVWRTRRSGFGLTFLCILGILIGTFYQSFLLTGFAGAIILYEKLATTLYNHFS